MSRSSPWWRVWDCNVHRACSSVQHALIAAGVMIAYSGAAHAVHAPVWTVYVIAAALSIAFGVREEAQQSGFFGRRHSTERGKWDSRRDWLYPTVVAFALAAIYHGVMR